MSQYLLPAVVVQLGFKNVRLRLERACAFGGACGGGRTAGGGRRSTVWQRVGVRRWLIGGVWRERLLTDSTGVAWWGACVFGVSGVSGVR
eukprot:3917920-Alexandrium_andersonii.AAC.1